MNIFVKIAVLVFLLSGCATPYQSSESNYGYGYSETRLDENKFSVRFIGTDADSAAVVSDYALLRAAEITLENGYTHFGIIDSRDQAEISSYTSPVQANTYVNPVTGQATTYTYGGNTYISSAPHSFKTIICYNGKPEDGKGVVFDAVFLKDSLRKKYELDKNPEKQQ